MNILRAMLQKIRLEPLTLLSGVLIVLAFPPHDFSFLIWIALIPWLVALRRSPSAAHSVVQGIWLGVLMSFGGFYWVAYSIHHYGNLPWPIAIPMYLIFCFICQPQFPVFAWIFFKTRSLFPRVSLVALFSVAMIYTGVDFLIPKIFTDHLGHSLYNAKWLVQAADIGGVSLLTFVIVLFNEGFAQLWSSRGALLKGRTHSAVAGVVGFMLLLGYGFLRYGQVTALQSAPVRAPVLGVIQANIGDFEKIAARKGFYEGGVAIMETYMSLSDLALDAEPKPDVIVWPETAYPSSFGQPRNTREAARDKMVLDYVKRKGVPLLFGGYDTEAAINKDYNSTFFLQPNGQTQVYHKSILLMFGETIPFYDDSEFLQKAFPTVGNFGRGPGPTVFEVPYGGGNDRLKFQPVICYEILFSQFLLDGANQGAEFILNVTNDSWFGPDGEPYLHLALASFRNIETRIPQLRSTNTGISGILHANGDRTDLTQVYEATTKNIKIPVTEPIPTLVKKWGDWFSWVSIFLSFLLVSHFLFKAKQKRTV